MSSNENGTLRPAVDPWKTGIREVAESTAARILRLESSHLVQLGALLAVYGCATQGAGWMPYVSILSIALIAMLFPKVIHAETSSETSKDPSESRGVSGRPSAA